MSGFKFVGMQQVSECRIESNKQNLRGVDIIYAFNIFNIFNILLFGILLGIVHSIEGGKLYI